MNSAELQRAVESDLEAGFRPIGVIACVGGTANGACDRVSEVVEVAKAYGLFCHVDAAWAGSAMICPEFRHLWSGAEQAESIVLNPHKWIGAQIDCSVQFLADSLPQRKALGLKPEYLETDGDFEVTDYSELTIPLGRRFRALKIWFVLRAYGLSGIRTMIRNHVEWVNGLEALFQADPDFEIVSSSPLAFFSFRYNPGTEDPDFLTRKLCNAINDDGRIYLTRASCNGKTAIRVAAGTFECTEEDVFQVYAVASELAKSLGTGARTG